ncbi:hypothetical protein IFT84_12675 [Rhizobium sp. CFBP 8762]|uniref:hypothetical protein n=1 Tax=Rhizobium sp. CFBP 8762 TaxID=2775279 RepID=UPI00177FE6AD|nr:hypothetical protein [Rhizobium sp. CFBP 8762]MBD8555360.1 hypothetical protein [Rhizobium sp. CFBP 8762]
MEGALLSPIAYPNLHTIIYAYVSTLEIIDLFLTPTDEMILASAAPITAPKTCSTHPAPQSLIPQSIERRFVTSNAQAAHDCYCGLSDCCLTTATLVDKLGLHRLQSFGKIPMGFSIHGRTRQ